MKRRAIWSLNATQERICSSGRNVVLQLISGVIVSLVAVSPCFPQNKIPVSITHSGNDSVGRSYVFQLKETIRNSASFELIESALSRPHIVIHVVTLDDNSTKTGLASAIALEIAYDSVNTPYRGLHLTTLVHSCGATAVRTCVSWILPEVDAQVTQLRESNLGLRYWRGLRTGNDDLEPRTSDKSSSVPLPPSQPKPARSTVRPPENPF